MKRGDLVTVALPGDYGKPRPAVVIQSDLFDAHPSVTILPVTSELREAPLFCVQVEPTWDNGLRRLSQVMVDKPQSSWDSPDDPTIITRVAAGARPSAVVRSGRGSTSRNAAATGIRRPC